MTIRTDALRWLSSKFDNVKGPVYTSKYYLPEESWPKRQVWWPQIPLSVINETQSKYINLLCQVAPSKSDFHYLRIPVTYFRDNLDKVDIIQGKTLTGASLRLVSIIIQSPTAPYLMQVNI